MKKLATFITASLLGITSVASAKPGKPPIELTGSVSVSVSGGITVSTSSSAGNAHASGTVVVRDHRNPPPLIVPPIRNSALRNHLRRVRPRPVVIQPDRPVIVLPSPWRELGTVATGKQTLRGDMFDNRKLDSLMLEVSYGVDLKQILINFGDGQTQLVKFDDVDAKRRFIDLAGNDREIQGMIIYSKGDRGSIKVFGRNDYNRTMPEPLTRWSKLGTMATGKQTLKLDTNKKFDMLALDVSGTVHLNKVLITYANGETQLVAYDETLTASMRTPIIDLAGDDRVIASVILYTDKAAHGEVTLFAL
jgi:hypothetical protein